MKDNLILEIKRIIDDRCEAELGQVHANSKDGKVTKTVDTSLIARDIYKYLTENAVVLNATETTEYLIDLLVDFDEMSFCPTTLTPNPDEYAIEWKQKLIYAIDQANKETAEKILKDMFNEILSIENCYKKQESKIYSIHEEKESIVYKMTVDLNLQFCEFAKGFINKYAKQYGVKIGGGNDRV